MILSSLRFFQIEKIMTKFDVDSVWTSGRLCNFHGCDAPHLQPKHINGDNHKPYIHCTYQWCSTSSTETYQR